MSESRRTWELLTMCRSLIGLRLKSTWYSLTVVSLICLPGCSGCESKTPPATSQTESSPASEQKPEEENSDASGSGSPNGPATESQTAGGAAADANSAATSTAERQSKTADGESNRSSAPPKSSKSPSGESSAQQGSGAGTTEGEGGNSGGGSAGGKSKAASQSGKPSSPGEAVATAQTLKLRSDKAAAGKEYGQAFELSAKAWESVQTFPKDAKCRELSNDLQRRLDELGTLANAQRGSDLKRDKPLIVR